MKELNIYIRKDLNMRKGKMAAQSAHSVMKLLFDITTKVNNKMIFSKQQIEEFNNFIKFPIIKINMVDNQEILINSLDKSFPFSIITDSGRTEFHGIPTVTCASQGIFSECDTSEMVVPHMYGKEIKAKQIFVFNKDVPLTKENACKLSVISCLNFLNTKIKIENDINYFDLSENNAFSDWILNSFAKIALSTKNMDEFNCIKDKLNSNSISFIQNNLDNNNCLCIEPCYPQNIDIITGHLSLI